MEECLGVNGRQLFVRVACNTVWKSDKTHVRELSYYNACYGKPCNCSQWINTVFLNLAGFMFL